MRAEILAIGDELVAGHRVDTNSAWLADRFRRLGIPTSRHTTVGDVQAELVGAIRDLAGRSDVVVSTGGLGPTQDDLTRFALAEAMGCELETDEAMVEHISSLFARRGRSMPESNRAQAQRPRGAEWIPNPHGTAPGVDAVITVGEHACRWFALPGVPAEMREMWEQSVEPAIRKGLPEQRVILVEELRCFGVGESTLESRLPNALLRGGNPEIGITVSRGTITLRITAWGANQAAARSLLDPVVNEIRAALGELVFGHGSTDLHDAVLELLCEQQRSLVTVEGPSRGLLANWLSTADPTGHTFRGGSVLALGGDAADLATKLAAARKEAQATTALGLATVSNTDEALIVLLDHDRQFQKKISLRAHPDIVADLAAKRALNFLRLHLR